jgi:hypothetical protein
MRAADVRGLLIYARIINAATTCGDGQMTSACQALTLRSTDSSELWHWPAAGHHRTELFNFRLVAAVLNRLKGGLFCD